MTAKTPTPEEMERRMKLALSVIPTLNAELRRAHERIALDTPTADDRLHAAYHRAFADGPCERCHPALRDIRNQSANMAWQRFDRVDSQE